MPRVVLVSPVSWTHHWVIAIPALLVAGTAVYRAGRAGKATASRLGAVGIAAVAVIGWTRLVQATPASGWLAMPAAAVACSAIYVVIGVLVLALAAGYQLRGIPRVPSQPSGPAEREHPKPLDEPSTWDHRHLPHGANPATSGIHRAFKG